MKIIRYNNGTKVRLHNRRVICSKIPSNECIIQFITMDNPSIPAALHTKLKNKAKATSIKLSIEAAQALWFALGRELKFINYEKQEKDS